MDIDGGEWAKLTWTRDLLPWDSLCLPCVISLFRGRSRPWLFSICHVEEWLGNALNYFPLLNILCRSNPVNRNRKIHQRRHYTGLRIHENFWEWCATRLQWGKIILKRKVEWQDLNVRCLSQIPDPNHRVNCNHSTFVVLVCPGNDGKEARKINGVWRKKQRKSVGKIKLVLEEKIWLGATSIVSWMGFWSSVTFKLSQIMHAKIC